MYVCKCNIELENHAPSLIKQHMDQIFKNIKCKQCNSENYEVTRKSNLVITSHCKDCNKDSDYYWFGEVRKIES